MAVNTLQVSIVVKPITGCYGFNYNTYLQSVIRLKRAGVSGHGGVERESRVWEEASDKFFLYFLVKMQYFMNFLLQKNYLWPETGMGLNRNRPPGAEGVKCMGSSKFSRELNFPVNSQSAYLYLLSNNDAQFAVIANFRHHRGSLILIHNAHYLPLCTNRSVTEKQRSELLK